MQLERVLLVGISHKTAPVDIRERVALDKDATEAALARLQESEFIDEALIVSTCNRTEIMVSVGGDEPIAAAVAHLHRFLAGTGQILYSEIEPYLYALEGEDAVKHLFRVASGLDSLVLGEGQILGQIREAARNAADADCLGGQLDYLLRQALKTGKRVRTETRIASAGRSVGSAAVCLAEQACGHLDGKTVLTIGAGDVAELVLAAFHRAGVTSSIAANRTYERALSLAQKHSARAIRFDDIRSALCEADIAISSTSAPGTIIQKSDVEAAVAERGGRPLFLLDMSVPRNIAPAVAEVPGVLLSNIDDLATVAELGLADVCATAEQIVDEGLHEVLEWTQSRSAVPMITALTAHFEKVRQDKVVDALSKMPELNDYQRRVVDELTRSLMNSVLHGPIQALKGQTHRRTVSDMFELDPEECMLG